MPNLTAQDAGSRTRSRKPARPQAAPSRRDKGGKTAASGASRRALAVLACLACLIGTACGQGESPNTADAPKKTAQVQPPAKSASPPQMAQTGAKRLLVVGDSLSISLGEQLEHALAGAPGVDFTRDGQRSTGLTRPELLDWPARLRELVAKAPPDVVIIMIGANDVMPLPAPDGGRVYFDQPAWPEAYAAKARELVAVCRQANPDVVVNWVGSPPMADPALGAGVKRVNAVLADMCAAAGCRFIDTEAAFSDPEGRYARHAKDAATAETTAVRTADGVHLTDAGSKLLAGVVASALAGREMLPPAAGLGELSALAHDLRPIPEAPAQSQHAPARRAPAAKTKARPSGKTYVVRQGDTFLGIAKRMGVEEDDIAALNPDADPRRLSIGQHLRLPARRK